MSDTRPLRGSGPAVADCSAVTVHDAPDLSRRKTSPAAVPTAHVTPDRTAGRARGPVVLEPGDQDARIGRMLREEVRAETGKPVVARVEDAGAARVAVEEGAAVATQPERVRVSRGMHQ